jgi:hypothetical protein
MDPIAAKPAQQETGRMSPMAAFERLCIELVATDALANAAAAAIDECAPPERSRPTFDRAQALIGTAAERAASAVALVEELEAAVTAAAAAPRR